MAAAREAGAEIGAAFNLPKSVSHKGKVDLVTETDQKCEALILARLMGAFPAFKFIGAHGRPCWHHIHKALDLTEF